MKVKIISSNPGTWYANSIGKMTEVKEYDERHYEVTTSPFFFLAKEDCVAINYKNTFELVSI